MKNILKISATLVVGFAAVGVAFATSSQKPNHVGQYSAVVTVCDLTGDPLHINYNYNYDTTYYDQVIPAASYTNHKSCYPFYINNGNTAITFNYIEDMNNGWTYGTGTFSGNWELDFLPGSHKYIAIKK